MASSLGYRDPGEKLSLLMDIDFSFIRIIFLGHISKSEMTR